MLDKRMEWTVRLNDDGGQIKRFHSLSSLSSALQCAEDWRKLEGKNAVIKIKRQLVAHFREV